jgi:hypothetical protein
MNPQCNNATNNCNDGNRLRYLLREQVVAFFCSEDAGYVTGQTITVDGGLRLV